MGQAGVEPQEKYLRLYGGGADIEFYGPTTETRLRTYLTNEGFVCDEKGVFVSSSPCWSGWTAMITNYGDSNTRPFSPPGIGA
jgi:hypothetical protein